MVNRRWSFVWNTLLSLRGVTLRFLQAMDDVVHSFASRFGLTEVEECEVVIQDDSQIQISKFLLVGKLLAHKNYSKKTFMNFSRNLWRPKASISIQPLNGDRFLFFF